MSRSRKKSPAGGNCTARSDRYGKTMGHRRTRHEVSLALKFDLDAPSRKLTENPWTYPKDGKQWYGYGRPELIRK
jgi:hypothetical protein